MPKLIPEQYAQALFEAASQTAPKDHDKLIDNFVKILAQNGDLAKHQEIERAYGILAMKDKGISSAEVTVARSMEVNSTLINQLNEIIGNKVEIKKRVDEGIVGGVVVRVDDTLIDASVKNQLNRLNKSLKS